MSKLLYNNVAVFCGSSVGNDEGIVEQARKLGEGLSEREVHIIYGGGDIGLMGIFARAAVKNSITSVIPSAFRKVSGEMHAHHTTIEVENLFQRKDRMIFGSDLAFILPGGTGTFDEVIEVAAFNDLNKHLDPNAMVKPAIIIDYDDYYDWLKAGFEKGIAKGFIRPAMRQIFHWAKDTDEAIRIYDDLRTQPPLPASALLQP